MGVIENRVNTSLIVGKQDFEILDPSSSGSEIAHPRS
jgi:hypothetical protein